MRPLKLFTLLCISASLMACGTDPETRVYGSWTEELTGDTIEFRRDGNLTWFGHEGTFSFKRSTNWAQCIGLSGCPTGQVAVDVNGQSFRISYYSSSFDQNPDQWSMNFRGISAVIQDIPIGDKISDGFVVKRNAPTVPLAFEGFDKMEDGLERLHPSMGDQLQVYNGEIVANIDYKLRRFNHTTNRWDTIGDVDSSYGYTLEPQIIYNHETFSLDGGYTWVSIPSLEEYNREGEPVAIGTTLFRSMRVAGDGATGTRETWKLDLGAANPSWEKRGETNVTSYEPMNLIAIAPVNYLARSQWTENGRLVELSSDEGATWTRIENDCNYEISAHSEGFYCTTMDNNVLWYNLESNAWTSFEVPSLNFPVRTTGMTDGIYLHQGTDLVKISGDGSQTVVGQLDAGDKNIGFIFVLEDRLIFNYKTIWTQLQD